MSGTDIEVDENAPRSAERLAFKGIFEGKDEGDEGSQRTITRTLVEEVVSRKDVLPHRAVKAEEKGSLSSPLQSSPTLSASSATSTVTTDAVLMWV
jgi:hypothetical protein